MPTAYRNLVCVSVYFDPDTYRKIDDMRNPKMTRSRFCATVIEEALGIQN